MTTFDLISQYVSAGVAVLGVLATVYVLFKLFWGGKFRFGGAAIEFAPDVAAEVARVKREISVPADGTSVDKQYLLLREYHAQGLAQSKISFWFSLVFAALGFLVIITAIFTMDRGVGLGSQGRTFISLIAGTIIDAVSALFFVQSNKARQLMVDFFDRLRSDKKLEESLRLAAAIDDKQLRSRLNTLISLHFADIKPTDSFLTSVFGIGQNNTTPTTPHESKQA